MDRTDAVSFETLDLLIKKTRASTFIIMIFGLFLFEMILPLSKLFINVL